MGMKYGFPKKPLTKVALQELIEKVKKRDGNFTNNEIMCFPLGTQVKIKDEVETLDDVFKAGGALVFQPVKDLDDNDSKERLFGILGKEGVCFHFRASEYEVVSLDVMKVPPY